MERGERYQSDSPFSNIETVYNHEEEDAMRARVGSFQENGVL
jgi:hypothetical protein